MKKKQTFSTLSALLGLLYPLVLPLGVTFAAQKAQPSTPACTAPAFLDPSDPNDQLSANRSGRYIVWKSNGSGQYQIKGYDLGPDLIFGTADDQGPNVIVPSIGIPGYGTPGAGGNFYPRVHPSGAILFSDPVVTQSSPFQFEMQLAFCHFQNCAATRQVLSTIPSYFDPLFGIHVAAGVFFMHDVSATTMVFQKNDFLNATSSIYKIDLISGITSLLDQTPYSPFPGAFNVFNGLFVDEAGVVSYAHLSGVFGPNLDQDFLFQLPSQNSPQFVTTISLLPSVSAYSATTNSMRGFQAGNETLLFYPRLETSGQYWDLVFRSYQNNQMSAEKTIRVDDGKQQVNVQFSFQPAKQKFLLGFNSYQVASGALVQASTELWHYDPSQQKFNPYYTFLPPTGFDSLYLDSVAQGTILFSAIDSSTSGNTAKVMIASCH